MTQIPPVSDITLALTIAGSLFLLRFLITVRRLRRTSGREAGESLLHDAARVRQPQAFGSEFEPKRRHALRQLYVGAVFSAAGIAYASWMLVSDVLGPFFTQAGGN